jgi:hypothetical protein
MSARAIYCLQVFAFGFVLAAAAAVLAFFIA